MKARVLAVIAVALITSSCEKKAEGQTVAVVNGDEITTAELNAELARSNISADADAEQARSRVLQSLVDRRLLTQAAQADGIDTSPEYLTQQRRMSEDLLLNMLAGRQINTAQLPPAGEISRYQASRPGMFERREYWNLEQIRFAVPGDRGLQTRLEATASLAEVAKLLGDSGVPFTRTQTRLDTAVVPAALYEQVAKLQPGEPFIIPSGGQAIANAIASREPAPLTEEESRTVAVSAMRREQSAQMMEARLKTLREAAKIEYKSGFAPGTKD